MAPVKTYSAPDLEGPFLKWLLKHLRLQQKEGKGLDLHLHADNLEERVSLHQVDQTFVHFDVLDHKKSVFIGPESDHWECLSVTD